jgi:hypothetical protein
MTPTPSSFPAKAVACCFSLSAFSIAIISGLGAGRTAASILVTALAALFVCHLLGAIAAAVIEAALREHLNRHRALRPIPSGDPSVAIPAEPVQLDQTD